MSSEEKQPDEILPHSRNIEFQSDVEQPKPKRQFRRSSTTFARLITMSSLQTLTTGNLLLHNAVFREHMFSIFVNVVTRILTMAMCIILLMLSTAYCVAQVSTVHLNLLNECEPKTKEEIYQHSYLAGLQEDGSVEINAESQWGHTREGCWTTKSYEMDTDRLWYSNFYVHQWNINFNHKMIFFGGLMLFSFSILIYNLYSIIMDIYHLRNNTIHTLSHRYRGSMNDNLVEQDGRFFRFIMWVERLLEIEDTKWIAKMLVVESLDLMMAVTSMLFYNGYSWRDPNNEEDVYLAEKPHFIMTYAAVIAYNMIGFAILWFLYAFASHHCYGLSFEILLFLVDDVADIFYTVFPLWVVYADDYNANSDNLLIVLGQLELENALSFLTTFGFLSFLCCKSLYLTHAASSELRNRYYLEFELEDGRSSWIDASETTKKFKQAFLTFVSLVYIALGVAFFLLVQDHFTKAEGYCESIAESKFIMDGVFAPILWPQQQRALEENPELFLWDHCLYKVYPFMSQKEQLCECRSFALDWNDLQTSKEQRALMKLTQKKLLRALLKHSRMLQKLSIIAHGDEDTEQPMEFSLSMFGSIHMKGFEWYNLGLNGMDSHIGNWNQLEFLRLADSESIDDEMYAWRFGELRALSDLQHLHLELKYVEFDGDLDPMCSLKKLQYLRLVSTHLTNVPKCFENMKSLRVLDFSRSVYLSGIPLKLFYLPELMMFSLSGTALSFQDLVNYNMPGRVVETDMLATTQFIQDNFRLNQDTEYYAQNSALCDPTQTDFETLPTALQEFVSRYCDFTCKNAYTLCQPHEIGNGRCDLECNNYPCLFDGGDCIQLCLVDGITNCSWDKLLNEVCDAECNNEFCSAYGETSGSEFSGEVQRTKYGGHVWSSDLFRCRYAQSTAELLCAASSATSSFMDPNIPTDLRRECFQDMIGNNGCDDACRTKECQNDGGDCQLECSTGCSTLLGLWMLFDPLLTYNLEINSFCAETYPAFMAQTQMPSFPQGENVTRDCNLLVSNLTDQNLNNDGYINYRESTFLFTYLASQWDETKDRLELDRRDFLSNGFSQWNCSMCVDYGNWNPRHEE